MKTFEVYGGASPNYFIQGGGPTIVYGKIDTIQADGYATNESELAFYNGDFENKVRRYHTTFARGNWSYVKEVSTPTKE